MEKEYSYTGIRINGFLMLFVQLLMVIAIVYCAMTADAFMIVLAVFIGAAWLIMMSGYIMLEPNQASVINPFMSTKKCRCEYATSTSNRSRSTTKSAIRS